jgi:uncharacterized protein
MKLILVPLLMLFSSALMALAWLGHLRFRDSIGFGAALALSWLVVLPEYVLNVGATRYGYGTYTGAQMASFHLAFGVVAVALVARFVLGERLTALQWVGFALLAVATLLITHRRGDAPLSHAPPAAERHLPPAHPAEAEAAGISL